MRTSFQKSKTNILVFIFANILGLFCFTLPLYFPLTIDLEWTIYEWIESPFHVFYYIGIGTVVVGFILFIWKQLLGLLLILYTNLVAVLNTLVTFFLIIGGHTLYVGFYGLLLSSILFVYSAYLGFTIRSNTNKSQSVPENNSQN